MKTTPPNETATASGASTAWLVGLLAVAAVLRWIGLGRDLWIDEVYTLVEFVRLPLGELLTNYSSDNQHLLYSLAAHVSITVFGESAVALRLPAVVFGLASLWATWRLAHQLAGRREAVAAVALLTVSYHHVWFSQNARGYTGLLFATVLATDLLLRALESDRRSLWTAYAATLAFGMGVHLTMIFVAAAHGLVVVGRMVRAKAVRRRALIAYGVAGALTLTIYAPVLPQLLELYLQPSGGTTTAAVEWKNPLWLVNETIRGLGVGLAFGWIGLAGAALLFAAGVGSYLRRAPVASTLIVLPAVLGGAALIVLGRNLWPRFFFNEFAFAALFAIRGATVLGEAVGRLAPQLARLRPAVVLAAGLVVASASTLPRNYRFPKQDFSGARDFVVERLGPGDRVVAIDLAGEMYRLYYATDRQDFFYVSTLDELEALPPSSRDTWVIYTLGNYIAAAQPELWRVVEERFETVRSFPGTLGGGWIVVAVSRHSFPREVSLLSKPERRAVTTR